MIKDEKIKLAIASSPKIFRDMSLLVLLISVSFLFITIFTIFFGWFFIGPLLNIIVISFSLFMSYFLMSVSKELDKNMEKIIEKYLDNRTLYKDLALKNSNIKKGNELFLWYDKIDRIFE